LLKTSNKTPEIKKQNLENSDPRRKRTGYDEIFSYGSGFALGVEPTQQAAGYSAPQNKITGNSDTSLRNFWDSCYHEPTPFLVISHHLSYDRK
jgi:hypothetical protein